MIFTMIICCLFYSCKENKDSLESGSRTAVKIRLLGVQDAVTTSKKASGMIKISGEQSQQIVFSRTSSFQATLSSETNNSVNTVQASVGKRANVVEERTPLAGNVMYKVLVYDNNGSFVTEKTYTNTVNNDETIELNAGKTYTFIAFSINSKNTVPLVNAQANLNTASIENISADLMYFKENLTLQTGTNNLDVNLKHMYSEITTTLNMDESITGAITNILNPIFNPTHVSANLKLSDGVLTYNGSNPAGMAVEFPALGTGLRQVSSTPTLLIHPGTTNGMLNFGSITIDGETKNNVSVGGLLIVPGQRYNLNLNFKTCTENVVGGSGMNWTYPKQVQNDVNGADVNGVFYPNGSEVQTTFTAPGADYGFVFDIMELDNSFNMKLNGVSMAVQEIQFQQDSKYGQNIRFADGSLYGGNSVEGGTIPQIFNMTGTATNPLVRVVISRNGQVNLFGSKSSGGELYPLVLFNGNTFNTFVWSNAAVNTVEVSQEIAGLTNISGYGTGKKKVSCTP
jgi:hypothetical protein